MTEKDLHETESETNAGGLSTSRRRYMKLAGAATGAVGFLGLTSNNAAAAPYTDSGEPHEIPGRIQAENFDTGDPGSAYGDSTDANRGGAYRDTPVDIIETDSGYKIGYITDGEFLSYTVSAAAGTYDIALRVAVNDSNGGDVRLSLNGTELGTASVSDTGGWQDWATVSITGVEIPEVSAGTLNVQFATNNRFAFDFDWIEFTARDTDTGADDGSDSDQNSETVPETISPQGVNNVLYAAAFDGDDLTAKLRAALAALPGGQGRVRITPKDDGTRWVWGSDVELNPREFVGLHIDIDDNVEIEYPGSGWALTLDTGGGFSKAEPTQATISGGQWYSTGDPQGWCRLIDTGKCTIDPGYVLFEGGSNAPVTGIQLRNRARWSEMNKLMPGGGSIQSDVCIDFVGASYNPNSVGGGTDSFQGNYLGPATLDTDVCAIRCQGNMQYCLFVNPQMFLFGDGASGIMFNADTRMWGLTVIGGKTEEHAANTSSFRFGPDFDGFFNTPSLIGGFYENPSNMITTASGAENAQIFNAVAVKNGYEIRAYTPEGTERATFSRDGDGVSLSLSTLEVSTIVDAESGNEYSVDELAGNGGGNR